MCDWGRIGNLGWDVAVGRSGLGEAGIGFGCLVGGRAAPGRGPGCVGRHGCRRGRGANGGASLDGAPVGSAVSGRGDWWVGGPVASSVVVSAAGGGGGRGGGGGDAPGPASPRNSSAFQSAALRVLDTTCFFARSMASANGTSHAPIHQLLGHADPRTTSIYTAAHASDLTAVLRNAGML